MNEFTQRLMRLKLELDIEHDKDVAQALGFTESALNERKRRDRFPVERLIVASQQKPELGIDVDFVLFGTPSPLKGIPARIVDGGCQKLPKFTPPTFDEMAAYMDAEMARLGIPQPGAAA